MELRLDKIPVPHALDHLMKDYCKAAIRVQPDDLLHWSWLYFKHCGGNGGEKMGKTGLRLHKFDRGDLDVSSAHSYFDENDLQSPDSRVSSTNENNHVLGEMQGISVDTEVSCFRVEVNRWHLPIVSESHLTSWTIQDLVEIFTDRDGYIAVTDIRSYWNGHGMNPSHLNDILHIVSPLEYRYLSRTLFFTLATGHVCFNLRHTLHTICTTLYEDKLIPLAEICDIYLYLALLDMGGSCEQKVDPEEENYEDSEPPPHYQFSSPDYVHIPYSSSSPSSSSPIYPASVCTSERCIHMWQDSIFQNIPRCDEIRRALMDARCGEEGVESRQGFSEDAMDSRNGLLSRGGFCPDQGKTTTPPESLGCTSRDGLPMWSVEMDAKGYVGVLEFVEKQLNPVKQSLEDIIQHLRDELSPVHTTEWRKQKLLNVERKKAEFCRTLKDAALKDNREAYDEKSEKDNLERLEIIRYHYHTLKALDEQMKALRQSLKGCQHGGEPELKHNIRTSLNRLLVEESYSDDQKILQKKLGKNIRPFITDNVNSALNLVDNVMGLIPDYTPLQDAHEALSQIMIAIDTHGTPGSTGKCTHVASERFFRTQDCPQPTILSPPPPIDSDCYDLSPALARTTALRYCVPGIGARVPFATIEQVLCYFKSKSSEQCGMIRGSNFIDILCPPLQ